MGVMTDNHCGCTHDGRGSLITECEEHRLQREALARVEQQQAETIEQAAGRARGMTTSWSVEGEWLTGNGFGTSGLSYAQAHREFKRMQQHAAVRAARLVRHVTKSATVKRWRKTGVQTIAVAITSPSLR